MKYAFDYAIANGRKKVTAVHKANILKHSDGLFLRVAREVAEEYKDSGIEFEDYIVDATCMQLVLHPEWWDVLVLPNLYGDILSDLAAGLIGGLGIAPGANIGADCAVFEPTHGSRAQVRGQGHGQPDRRDPLGDAHAQAPGRDRGGRPHPRGGARGDRRGREGHLRHQALGHRQHRRLPWARRRTPTR